MFCIRSFVLPVVLISVLSLFAGSAFSQEPVFIHDFQIPSLSEMGSDVPLDDPGVSRTPPLNPEVGDSWTWWLWTWQPMPPHFEEQVCTVRGKSDRGYVVVKDSEWLVSIDQADVDSILLHWESISIGPYPDQGIYEIDSLSFGTPPDELDNDPRIYLMWYNFQVSADGFFFYFDEYPEGAFPGYHSNECEVLYLNTTSSGGPSGDYMLAVVAHEFEHMIHWKQDENESSWVNEGMAELAMWFYGHPDNISSFNSNPDNNLTIWDGEWADYIQTYLWSLYFFERYGGHPAVYALVQEPADGMAGYDAVLDAFAYAENTDDIFIDWSVANFLDDTSIADGRYGYTGEELPAFSVAGTYSTYPVSASKTVNNWGTDYYRFQSITFNNMEITFDGADNNIFGVRALVLHESAPTEVLSVMLDESTQSGTLNISGLTYPSDQVILVVASVSSSGAPDYGFTAAEGLGIESDPSDSGSMLNLIVSPNPSSGSVNMQLNWTGAVSGESPVVNIYDLNGRIVQSLAFDVHSEGSASVEWNGETFSGVQAGSGIYYARAGIGNAECTTKIMLLK
jgi:hypothetical protein